MLKVIKTADAGNSEPLDFERNYLQASYASSESFPDYAHDFDALLDDGSKFTGIIYVPDYKHGWEARTFTAGDQDLQMIWHANGVLAYALSYAPVHEEFSWFQDGSWKACNISLLDAADTGLSMKFEFDGRLEYLLMHRWKDALCDPRRKTSFHCINRFDDLYKLFVTQEFSLNVDDEFTSRTEEIENAGFLNKANVIHWYSETCVDSLIDLFAFLSKKNLKKVIFESYESSTGDFVASMKSKLPQLDLVSMALNLQGQQKK